MGLGDVHLCTWQMHQNCLFGIGLCVVEGETLGPVNDILLNAACLCRWLWFCNTVVHVFIKLVYLWVIK